MQTTLDVFIRYISTLHYCYQVVFNGLQKSSYASDLGLLIKKQNLSKH